MDAILAAQLESMAQELGKIREIHADLKDIRGLIEALTGMIGGLTATQGRQEGNPEQKVTSEEDQPVQAAAEPGIARDHDVPETAESTPSAL